MVILSADRMHWGTRVWVSPLSFSVKAESVLIDEGERESHIRGCVIITLTAITETEMRGKEWTAGRI